MAAPNPLAIGWQQIPEDDFNYGFVPNIHLFTPRKIPGYMIIVQLRGHRTCSCQRGQRIAMWRPHNYATGDWPAHYLVEDEYRNAFLHANPNMELAPGSGPATPWKNKFPIVQGLRDSQDDLCAILDKLRRTRANAQNRNSAQCPIASTRRLKRW